MNTNEKKVPMNRSGLDSRSTHYQPFTRSAVLALALVALIAVNVLPAPIRRSRIEPKALNVPADVTPVLDMARAAGKMIGKSHGWVAYVLKEVAPVDKARYHRTAERHNEKPRELCFGGSGSCAG